VEGIEGLHIVSGDLVEVGAASALWVPVRVQMPPAMADHGSHPIRFRIEENRPDGAEVIEKSVFLVPR
jgi:hypothetical protein